MGEISAGFDDSIDVGVAAEISVDLSESGDVSVEKVGSESFSLSDNVEIANADNFDTEIIGGKDPEGIASENESFIQSVETMQDMIQTLETPESLEQAQRSIENYHHQSIAQILEINGKYMSETDQERISQGVNSIKAVEHNPARGYTGYYLYLNGKSIMEISAINNQQMERSTKHETNHFASKNSEIIVPQPDRRGYTVYQTMGTMQSSWFHSAETGKDSEFTSKGRGLNEGLTTMYTNQQLMELSREKCEAAERQGVYAHTTELCNQLESIVGKDTLKEAYYGGNIQNLEAKVNALAGGKIFDMLRESLDKTISRDYVERIEGMKEAQAIFAKMYEKRGRQA